MTPDLPWVSSTELAPVLVDQRSLVDKMLARYSGDFTVFRELVQNADDAESSAVEICFMSAQRQGCPTRQRVDTADLKSIDVTHWTIRNNGKPLTQEDWNRLTSIAMGNPDSRKIGAFGVGFYSVFSVTENPRITSESPSDSSKACEMQFEWNENQLCFRKNIFSSRGASDTRAGRWITTIELPLRKVSSIPRILDLMRFLASSITFMVYVRNVRVFLDKDCIGDVEKSSVQFQTIDLPEGIQKSIAKEVNMNVTEIHHHRVTIKANMGTARETMDFSVFTAKVNATTAKDTHDELVRCMKKEPPPELEYSLIYMGEDDDRNFERHAQENQYHERILHGFRADVDQARDTHIFIGHATVQTTGIRGHMASRFIPTVERELIDFSDTSVAIPLWNSELLRIGGILCRAVYEWELSNIQQSWDQQNVGAVEFRSSRELDQHFLHVLQFFMFHSSAPSPKVAELLANSFYGCSRRPLMFFSSAGVREAPDIRNFDPTFAFLRSLPMLTEYIARNGSTAMVALPEKHKIHSVEPADVRRSLCEHALDEDQLVACLRWWIDLRRNHSTWTKDNLLRSATLSCAGGRKLSLSSVKYFIDPKGLGAYIPSHGPLPESLLPLNIYRSFSRAELMSIHWQEFTVAHWLRYLSDSSVLLPQEYDLTVSPSWAECVLGTLLRLWPSLSDEQQSESKKALETKTCIPTTRGLCRPDCSYLLAANNNPFHDIELAIVRLNAVAQTQQEMRMLEFIGVRSHIPPRILRDRIRKGWEGSVSDLIRYLVKERIPPSEIDALKTFPLFPKAEPTQNAVKGHRYRADELYPPEPIFYQLQLPIIGWDARLAWSKDSAEARLLYQLGLRPFPPLETIIRLCLSTNMSLRTDAFTYLYQNLRSFYSDYNSDNFREIALIPAENISEGKCWRKPDDVCWGSQWKALGFSVVATLSTGSEDHFDKLGIQQHPSPTTLLNRLRSQPQDEKASTLWFECMADCTSNLSDDECRELSGMQIVPTRSSGDLQWVTPKQCYLAGPQDDFIGRLFIFVDFGAKANEFLIACHSKNEPSMKDIAESLIDNPVRFYEISEGPLGFMAKLRELAKEAERTPDLNDTLADMQSQPTLLGMRRKSEEYGQEKDVYELRKPQEIVIVDDTKDEELFSDLIWAVPQKDLEPFYSSVGCRKLSKVIKKEYEYSEVIYDQETSSKVRDLVLERLPIFIERCTHSQPEISLEDFTTKLEVKVCDRLRIHKTFTIGKHTPKLQDVWAATRGDTQTSIELWISRRAKDDVYDLSVSLCRVLFATVKSQDTLVLAAVLSNRELLKRAGYVPSHPPVKQDFPQQGTNLDCNESKGGSDLVVSGTSASQKGTCPLTSPCPDASASTQDVGHTAKESSGVTPCTAENRIMSQDFIRKRVNSAIKACNSGTGNLRSHPGANRQLDSRYCDDQGPAGTLQHCGKIKDIEVLAAESLPEFDTLIEVKQEHLGRFVGIIIPILDVFKLHKTSLRIFYDLPGGPIAFNRGGKINLNLRFFEEWHDTDVKNGDRKRAQSSWFFTLAHEIAHNIVVEHNSDHEFWFSVICEEHVAAFSRLQRSKANGVKSSQSRLSRLASVLR